MHKKEKILGCLGEILGELIITAVFFGLGWLILAALGIEIDSESVDFELIILLGIGVFAAAGAVIYLITKLMKHKTGTPTDKNDNRDAEDTEADVGAKDIKPDRDAEEDEASSDSDGDRAQDEKTEENQ